MASFGLIQENKVYALGALLRSLKVIANDAGSISCKPIPSF